MKTKKYVIEFKKEVYGTLLVEAESAEAAKRGEWVEEIDEYENKSYYEYGNVIPYEEKDKGRIQSSGGENEKFNK